MLHRLCFTALLFVMPSYATQAQYDEQVQPILIENFESSQEGQPPEAWRYFTRKQEWLPLEDVMKEDQKFTVVEDEGNKFVRAYTQDEAQRISLMADAFGWDLQTHPRLRWRWRALRLPAGAREDKKDDVGGAVYVTFDKTDWLGRPYSIKYTYSSSLPVGETVSNGPVKVIVAASGVDGTGVWKTAERDIVADYRRVFGGNPPDTPFTITLWSDSDNTNGIGEVDFDDLMLLPPNR